MARIGRKYYKDSQIESIKDEAKYFILNHSTIRETAKHFGVSKTKIHDDFMKRLPDIDNALYQGVRDQIAVNIATTQQRFTKMYRNAKEDLTFTQNEKTNEPDKKNNTGCVDDKNDKKSLFGKIKSLFHK